MNRLGIFRHFYSKIERAVEVDENNMPYEEDKMCVIMNDMGHARLHEVEIYPMYLYAKNPHNAICNFVRLADENEAKLINGLISIGNII